MIYKFMKTFNIKCVMLGNSAVGKTSIIQSFLSNNINDTHDSTIGASFVSKRFKNRLELKNAGAGGGGKVFSSGGPSAPGRRWSLRPLGQES